MSAGALFSPVQSLGWKGVATVAGPEATCLPTGCCLSYKRPPPRGKAWRSGLGERGVGMEGWGGGFSGGAATCSDPALPCFKPSMAPQCP